MAEICAVTQNRCEHGKSKRYCRECASSTYCEHNKIKYSCVDCAGPRICPHKKRKELCVECGGSQLCKHKKESRYCKECNGSSFCAHGKRKDSCSECGGSGICEHLKRRTQCKECGGGSFCVHGLKTPRCRECGGSEYCSHNKRKSQCKECEGTSICQHGKFKPICKECGGSSICSHGRYKINCKPCGGKNVCVSEWCHLIPHNKKYEGYCLRCFVNLFPDKPNTRNYKTKEKSVVDNITESFPQFTWVADKRVQDGCSLRRPDLLLDLGSHIIIVEVDENKHTDYDCSCEHKRLMELSRDLHHRPIVFIRFNPDDYVNKDNTLVKSCWKVNKLGVMQIMKTKESEWKERMECLKQQIQYWIDNTTEKTVEIVELFY